MISSVCWCLMNNPNTQNELHSWLAECDDLIPNCLKYSKILHSIVTCSFIVRVCGSVNPSPTPRSTNWIPILFCLLRSLSAARSHEWTTPITFRIRYADTKDNCDVYGVLRATHSNISWTFSKRFCATSSRYCSSFIACCACSQRAVCSVLVSILLFNALTFREHETTWKRQRQRHSSPSSTHCGFDVEPNDTVESRAE